jgi:hypothetical protein
MNRTVRFTLTGGAVISGRLQDGAGHPLAGVRVQAARIQLRNGKRILTRVPNSLGLEDPVTNDLGDFRIFWLPPGEYFVVAEGAAGGVAEKDYDPSVYYPGTTDFKFAGRILVDEGKETRADFTIRPVAGVTLSGTIAGADSSAIRGAAIRISPVFPGLALQTHQVENSSDEDSAGRFQIQGVPPGSYDLIALFEARSGAPRLTGRVRVEVGHEDLTGIRLELREGREIRGRFLVSEDIRPNVWLDEGEVSSLRFSFSAALESVEFDDRLNVRADAENREDLEFSNRAVTESLYRVTAIGGLKQDGYVADIRANGRTVCDDGVIEIGRDARDLEFDIRGNGGVIEGTVTLPFQTEVTAPIAMVLMPDKPRRGCMFLYKRTEASSGLDTPIAFTFKGVAPGSYRILALDHLFRGDEMNADLIAQYEQRGVAVTLAAGARLEGIQAPLIRTRMGSR